jgi:hypothetical protein
MSTQELDFITKHVEKLEPHEQLLLIERIAALLRQHAPVLEETDDDLILTDEEVRELLQPEEPMTGKQIAEAGLLGGWKDMGIEDSVEWVAQQRAKRIKKINW